MPGVKYVYDRRVAADGKRSLSLQKSANRYFPIAGWFKAVDYDGQHRALKMAVKVKASKVTKAIVDAQFYDANGQMLNHEWLAYIGQKEDNDPIATHNWKTYEGAAEIPAGTSASPSRCKSTVLAMCGSTSCAVICRFGGQCCCGRAEDFECGR